jgi:hypothetical protein
MTLGIAIAIGVLLGCVAGVVLLALLPSRKMDPQWRPHMDYIPPDTGSVVTLDSARLAKALRDAKKVAKITPPDKRS